MRVNMNTRRDILQSCSIVEQALRNRLADGLSEPQRREVEVALEAARSLRQAPPSLAARRDVPDEGPASRELALHESPRQPRLGRPVAPPPAIVIGQRPSGTPPLFRLLDSPPHMARV